MSSAVRNSARSSEPGIEVPAVGSVMHGPVVSVDADDMLWDAMDLMLNRGLRHLVVVKADEVRGMLVDRELAAVWAMNPLGLKHTRVGDILGPVSRSVSPDVDVLTAVNRMRAAGIDALVVVDSAKRPLGVVTDHDMLGILAALLGGAGAGVSDAEPRYHGSGRPRLLPD